MEPGAGKKCLASNGANGLSLKNYDEHYPHPDTLFVITEA